MDNGVDAYLKGQESPIQRICTTLRGLILKEFPGIREEMMMGVPWYGGKFYIVALKDHVNLGISIGGLSKKELALFEGKGRFMRHIKLFPGAKVKREEILKLLRIAAKSKCTCP